MSKVLSYAQLMSEQNSLEAIREGARVICERRGRYADAISNDVERIKSEISVIESLIKTIEKNSSVLDDKQKPELETLCKQLKESLKAYIQEARSLCTRFNNKKIKVLAFGSKSQGKSTFTRLYTGLPESVVAVKATGDDRDKTGALSVISHKKGSTVNNPQITVYFKTCDSILKTVNSCISQLSILPNFSLPNSTSRGYKSWNDLSSVLANVSTKKKAYDTLNSLIDFNNQVTNFDPVKSFLKSVFETESSFVEVKEVTAVKQISLAELPLYNDMTNNGERRYLSVERIEIAADLGYNDVFENFEICDTKGISAKAGAELVEEDVYNDINNSDAAFSIQRVGQGQKGTEFYVGLSNSIKKVNEELKPEKLSTKHFAILNLEKDIKNASVDEVVNAINGSQLAKCIYIGSFATKEGSIASYEGVNIDAKNFSTSLVIDMLSKIVNSTKESDDLYIQDCNKLASEIETNRKSLVDSLSKLVKDDDKFNIGAILPEQIEKLRIAAIEALIEEANDQKTSLSDEIESERVINKQPNNKGKIVSFFKEEVINDVFKENNPKEKTTTYTRKEESIDEELQNIRVFKMITAEDKDEVIKTQLGKCKNASDAAIRYILDSKVKDKAGANVKMNGLKVTGTVETLGGYIDSVCSTLYGIIEDNINVKYSPSQSIESIVNFREEIYKKVWKALKLDALIGDFGKVALDGNINNEIVNKWVGFYNDPIKDLQCSVIVPQQSFNVLIAYFKDLEDDNESNKKTGPIVDWKKLDEAILEAYRRYGFGKRVLEKLANEVLLKNNVIRKLFASLRNPNFTNDIMGLYAGNKAEKLKEKGIIEKEQYDKIKSKEQWDALCDAAQQLVEKRVSSLPNII